MTVQCGSQKQQTHTDMSNKPSVFLKLLFPGFMKDQLSLLKCFTPYKPNDGATVQRACSEPCLQRRFCGSVLATNTAVTAHSMSLKCPCKSMVLPLQFIWLGMLE